MSAKGQKRTQHRSKTASLFDHLVGAGEQRGWNGNSERFGGREIEYEIEFRRLLDRDVAGLRPAPNPFNQRGDWPEQGQVVWSVGHETPGLDKITGVKDRR